jgi:hypothetical protein
LRSGRIGSTPADRRPGGLGVPDGWEVLSCCIATDIHAAPLLASVEADCGKSPASPDGRTGIVVIVSGLQLLALLSRWCLSRLLPETLPPKQVPLAPMVPEPLSRGNGRAAAHSQDCNISIYADPLWLYEITHTPADQDRQLRPASPPAASGDGNRAVTGNVPGLDNKFILSG